MFFYLSKIFWMIATPLSFIWVLVIIGFGLRYWKKALGNQLLAVTAALFVIIGFLPIGYNMMVLLERQYERPSPMPPNIDGIIVLGGAFNSTLSDKTGMMSANGNINRMIDFVDLANKYPKVKLVFAGGSSSMHTPERKEADDAKDFLKIIGMNTNNIIFERESRNSYENIKNSYDLLKPKPNEKWIVITSSFHMPRVIGIFKQQKWNVIPYPSGPKTDGHYKIFPKPFGVVGSFFMLGKAMKEFIGSAIYYVSGKSSFVFPLSPLRSEKPDNTVKKRSGNQIMLRKYFKKIFLAIVFTMISLPAYASTQNFDVWLKNMRSDAARQGISQKTINMALSGITPIQRVIELDRKQPEGTRTFAQYKKSVVNENRVKKGRRLLREHARALQEVENKYGVPKQFIVALWGIETNFGGNTGGFKVVPALATLAWEGRRAKFFRKELINALKIIDAGHVTASGMKGSWAGAMGQNQFMPSSFNAYAVDHNGDGKRDIWGTKIDIFASTANYLKRNGWIPGQRWGRRVILPSNFSKNLVGPKIKKPLSYWRSLGIKTHNGAPLPQENMTASIVAPDGLGGEAYIVYNNYQTIMDWNRSTYFATSVGLLADRIAQ